MRGWKEAGNTQEVGIQEAGMQEAGVDEARMQHFWPSCVAGRKHDGSYDWGFELSLFGITPGLVKELS
jgi:hypothetical protein